jgi:tRNA-uridine 2-sulfurtransferase
MALSGGIDSAVSLHLLLKQGYEVEAAFMKNWSSTTGLKLNECPWLVDRQDALRVAAYFKVPLHTIDFEKEYTDRVMSYFFEEYKAGRTPNPDVMCNKEIKFKLLYEWAMTHGFDYIATGHYARVAQYKKRSGVVEYKLQRSRDEFKDQTYFIYNIKTEQLPHILFPIGGMKKTEVRKLAQKLKLPNADKKESMGLCFVGKIRLKDFLEQKLKAKSGLIVNRNGLKVGEHNGLHNYTIGQRQGIGIGGNDGPWYVAQKSLVDNLLVVTNDPEDEILKTREIEIHSTNWINFDPLANKKIELRARFRHQGNLEKLILSPISAPNKKDQYYKVVFEKPQLAIASGQSLVLYHKDLCVGGGVIV